MGYSEIYCHICGVSFNIARRRKPGEPALASWDYTGRQCDEPGVDEVDLENCARNGCFAALTYPKDDESLDDPDYVPNPGEGDYDEPEEYDSEYESSTSGDDSINDDADCTDESNPEMDYSNWLAKTLNPQTRFPGEPVGNFGSSNLRRDESVFPITPTMLSDGHDPEELEHIPSRTCTEAQAYSGYAISLEEMRGCRTAQCLIHRDEIQQGSSPSIQFSESWKDSEWFLSGLCDGLPSRDCNYPTVWPAQGGVDEPRMENVLFDPEYTTPNELPMPFHPWCFDIFSRQSKARFNRINISGLMKWRNAEFSYDDFHGGFPRSADVLEAQEQWWEHVPGKEYLAANPLYVPGLRAILQNASEDVTLSKNSQSPTLLQTTHDVFLSLPPEIRILVVRGLDADDVNSLRAASRAFTNLPNSVWRALLRAEMPWLWECWNDEDTHVPSFWTTVTANELLLFKEERERYSAQLKDEYTSSEVVDFLLPLPKQGPSQVELELSKGNLDWHAVYTQIKRDWGMLRGLRNRRRIWEDVEEIIRRIEKYEAL